jgi:ubiquinone/menaquinone biosynthesis C-methylase UbiE
MKNIIPHNIPVSPQAAAGTAVYTKFVLFFYDLIVMLFENHFVWKCSTKKIINFYNCHISNQHLDVGVGTGYFLDKCTFPSKNPVIHLIDLNINTLEMTSKRINRYHPIIHQWNILEPIKIDLPQFDSICISNILHCLPGNFKTKEIVFKNLKQFIHDNGTLFGLTILGKDVHSGLLYKLFNRIYNNRLIFSNSNDSLNGLEDILKSNFSNYELELIGSVALFSCQI